MEKLTLKNIQQRLIHPLPKGDALTMQIINHYFEHLFYKSDLFLKEVQTGTCDDKNILPNGSVVVRICIGGDDRDTNEKKIAKRQGLKWQDLLDIQAKGFIGDMFEDDTTLHINVPFSIAKNFPWVMHYIEEGL